MLTLNDVLSGMNYPMYEVVYNTYGGDYATFNSFDENLNGWLDKYGECSISRIDYIENVYGDYVQYIYLDGWNSGGASCLNL